MLTLYELQELSLTDDDRQVYGYWDENGVYQQVVLVPVKEWEEMYPIPRKEDNAPWEWEME